MSICKAGHIFDGYCKICKAAYYEANKEKILARINVAHHANKERENAKSRAYYEANKESAKAYRKEYSEKNADAIAKHKREYRVKNIEKISAYLARNKERTVQVRKEYEAKNRPLLLEKLKKYNAENRLKRNAYSAYNHSKNKELVSARKKKYATENPDKVLALAAKRRALLEKRKPSWYDHENCQRKYAFACAEWHVDHIVPLKGTLVSGLHWSHNLQLLPAKENLKKHNKFDPETYVHELPIY